ncbi:hypothetical protein QTP88_020771 [Uroleucon formosanum]
MYYCYKSFFSIGLLAVTDANYKFVMVSVGSYGKENDAGVFDECPFREAIETGRLKVPKEELLPGSGIKTPYVLIGDAAFPLKNYLMRPFPDKTTTKGDDKDNFNYRLSRARMVVECSFESINETEVVIFQDSYRNTPRTLQYDLQKRLNASSRAAMQVRKNFKLYFEQHPIQRM